MEVKSSCIAVRTSNGISIISGPPAYDQVAEFTTKDDKLSQAMAFSPDGQYFAWFAGCSIKIALCETWEILIAVKNRKRYLQGDSEQTIKFSPKGTYIITCERNLSHDNGLQQEQQIFKLSSGKLIKSFVQNLSSQDNNLQWTSDETVCGILMKDNVLFFENGDFATIAQTIKIGNHGDFQISSGSAPHHILCYQTQCGECGNCWRSERVTPVRLFQYPKLEISEAIINNSDLKFPFIQNRIKILWNDHGTSVLVMSNGLNRKYDSSMTRYVIQEVLYLYCFSTKGKTTKITLGNFATMGIWLAWSPTSDEFCVLSEGEQLLKATVCNLTTNTTFECGKETDGNMFVKAKYNPQGNMLLLEGFTAFSTSIVYDVWDMEKKEKITSLHNESQCHDWLPDGEHLISSFTVNVSMKREITWYKIFHYTGQLLYKKAWTHPAKLWEVAWQSFPKNTFPKKPIMYKFDKAAYIKSHTNETVADTIPDAVQDDLKVDPIQPTVQFNADSNSLKDELVKLAEAMNNHTAAMNKTIVSTNDNNVAIRELTLMFKEFRGNI